MATTRPEHLAEVFRLGRFAGWLACKLLEADRQPVFAARCACGWVGPPQLNPVDAAVDGIAHDWESAH